MKIGTTETIEEKGKKRKLRSTFSSGSSSNGGNRNRGGGGGGNDGGGDNHKNDFYEDTESKPNDKFRVGMWFLLLVVMMTFGGLIGAYVVIATKGEIEWKPFALPFQVWVSTVLIFFSSLTYQISNNALQSENQTKAKNWLLATTVLGAMFISSQILAWFELARQGVYVASNPYAGFFYILTAVHALHVFGGILVLGYILLRTWNKTFSDEELDKRQSISNAVGLYWHFMDGLWIVLFVLLGFWK
ncbi:MAG: heme-copper oxidase subunit III [Acidobacteria bacterium]|jgi:cytochrome c oxidase subunit 3|nr:heme-copper oxidase subunit III [Acidobacteriota bacterium]